MAGPFNLQVFSLPRTDHFADASFSCVGLQFDSSWVFKQVTERKGWIVEAYGEYSITANSQPNANYLCRQVIERWIWWPQSSIYIFVVIP